jgi:hypothetical protein
MWMNTIDEVDKHNGWLFGVESRYIGSHSIAFGKSKLVPWSEAGSLTVDNQYLHLLLQGGIIAAMGYVIAMFLLCSQFWRYKQWLWLSGLLACLIIDLNLRSGSLTQVYICLAGGSACAELAAKEVQPLLAKRELARGAVKFSQALASDPALK